MAKRKKADEHKICRISASRSAAHKILRIRMRIGNEIDDEKKNGEREHNTKQYDIKRFDLMNPSNKRRKKE